ncbi:hypothetical protein ACFL5F_04360 [Planctomycetota bacterium]
MKGDYEEFHALKAVENKANMPAFGRKSEILSPKSKTDRMEAERQIPARFTECDLKKQSQFQRGRMSVSVYVKWDYEVFHALGRRENKANSKPISVSTARFIVYNGRIVQ